MNVCDVPLCANMSVGASQPLMGVPKGIPRVNCVETRQRLRNRLHKKRETLRENAALANRASAQQNSGGSSDTSTHADAKLSKDEDCKKINVDDTLNLGKLTIKSVSKINNEDTGESLGAGNSRMEDIDKIINYIEGKENNQLALKKAAKKARQKLKKEEERVKKDLEEKENERIEAEKKRQEEKLKKDLLARENLQAAANAASKKKTKKSGSKKEAYKNDNCSKQSNVILEQDHFEETIPAMVTIKRIVENNNSPPTVTITLKGSTPDQDKLLFTLVNGHNDVKSFQTSKSDNRCKENESKNNNNKKKKNNNSKENISCKTNSKNKEKTIETSKELKVTLAVDKSFRKELELKCQVKNRNKTQVAAVVKEQAIDKLETLKVNKTREIIDIQSLKLPPGITITKVNGPINNKKANNVQSSEYSSVPVNKSGVIVVDTEKLIQQSTVTKKGKKKKKKSQQSTQSEEISEKIVNKETPMVTLKNPVFHKINNKLINNTENIASSSFINMNEQATISKGADGMVTIRRPHPIALPDESPISEYLAPKITQEKQIPSPLSLEQKIIRPPSPRAMNSLSKAAEKFSTNRIFPPNVLWGLPGIQVTRVNRNAPPMEPEQVADVSIIRTGGFNLDKDDWPYESVFKPKDILEDELDADERELEAFKRFCEQSVPPKHKEKVAHLNVKDIVLMKKNDVTYS